MPASTLTTTAEIRYFAAAAQFAGRDDSTLPVSGTQTLKDVAAAGADHSAREAKRLPALLDVSSFLVHGSMYPADTLVSEVDCPDSELIIEVLPPFAGG